MEKIRIYIIAAVVTSLLGKRNTITTEKALHCCKGPFKFSYILTPQK